MIRTDERQNLEVAKQQSTGQLLMKCARLFDEVAVARNDRQAGRPLLRPAHTKLLPHIDVAGSRISTIAGRLGVTKQAVSQWVGELAALGVVELGPDPDDGRAKQVRFTRRGLGAIHDGLAVLREIEAQAADRIGRKPMAALAAALAALAPVLEDLAAQEQAPPSVPDQP